MIVARAPVRFSLGGGGTDLPSYSEKHGGFSVAVAIDRFVHVVVIPRFFDSIRVSQAKTETVDSVDHLEHRLFREALKVSGITRGVEASILADVPTNAGLGAWSSLGVAALGALRVFTNKTAAAEHLAADACAITLERLGDPIGRQDAWIAALGGLSCFTFHPDGRVEAERLPMRPELLAELETNLLVFYSGVERASFTVLHERGRRIAANEEGVVEHMHRIKELGRETARVLVEGDIDAFGEILHETWTLKRKLATNMSSSIIDEHYDAARRAGALGGKLMGAGGGGFFLLYARPQDRRNVYGAMTRRGLRPLRFRFEPQGVRINRD